MDKTKEIVDILELQNEDEIVRLYNLYAPKNSYNDIWLNNEEALLIFFSDIEEAIHQIKGGHYSSSDKYFIIDGYGSVKSFSDIYSVVDLEKIAEFVLEEESAFENEDIQEYLDTLQ